MNKRIQELAEQATTIEYGSDRGFDRVTFDKEKLAELIVRTCMSFQDETGVYSKFDMADAIAQHFGVGE